jgi:hypothetical protein
MRADSTLRPTTVSWLPPTWKSGIRYTVTQVDVDEQG